MCLRESACWLYADFVFIPVKSPYAMPVCKFCAFDFGEFVNRDQLIAFLDQFRNKNFSGINRGTENVVHQDNRTILNLGHNGINGILCILCFPVQCIN